MLSSRLSHWAHDDIIDVIQFYFQNHSNQEPLFQKQVISGFKRCLKWFAFDMYVQINPLFFHLHCIKVHLSPKLVLLIISSKRLSRTNLWNKWAIGSDGDLRLFGFSWLSVQCQQSRIKSIEWGLVEASQCDCHVCCVVALHNCWFRLGSLAFALGACVFWTISVNVTSLLHLNCFLTINRKVFVAHALQTQKHTTNSWQSSNWTKKITVHIIGKRWGAQHAGSFSEWGALGDLEKEVQKQRKSLQNTSRQKKLPNHIYNSADRTARR